MMTDREFANKEREHVNWCFPEIQNIQRKGDDDEERVRKYLLTNLKEDPNQNSSVGNYRILPGVRIPQQRFGGASGDLEIDLVVITKFGVFLIEVKGWEGKLEGYQSYWLLNGRERRANPLPLVLDKARILRGNLFDENRGKLPKFGKRVSVVGFVVLTKSREQYQHLNDGDVRLIKGLDSTLIHVLSSRQMLFRRDNDELSDFEIKAIERAICEVTDSESREKVINNRYRVLGELPYGDNYMYAYRVQDVQDHFNTELRLKEYHLPFSRAATTPERRKSMIDRFMRGGLAVKLLGQHLAIAYTHAFVQDENNLDVFYEVTERLTGKRLDELMEDYSRGGKNMPLVKQLEIVLGVLHAFQHMHNFRGKIEDQEIKGVMHRNLSTKSIYMDERGQIKIADFDFAKLGGGIQSMTVFQPGETAESLENDCMAPEVRNAPSSANAQSDLYSLGAVWYKLASLPQMKDVKLSADTVEDLLLPENAQALLKELLQFHYGSRPQSTEVTISRIETIQAAEKAASSPMGKAETPKEEI